MARRPGLDEGVIVRAAADLVDAEGIEALALGRLAERLSVRAPSLYNHVTSLDGVRRGLALLGARELTARLARAAIGTAGEAGVFALAAAYRRFAKERPGLYAATLRAPDPDDRALHEATAEVMEVVQAVLAPYGLRGAEEAHAIRAWRSLVHGFVSLETTGGFGLPLDLDESFRRLVRLFIAGLCAEARGDESARPDRSMEETTSWHAPSPS